MSRSPGGEAKRKPGWGRLRELGSGDRLEENKQLWVVLCLFPCSLGPVGPTGRVGSTWALKTDSWLQASMPPRAGRGTVVSYGPSLCFIFPIWAGDKVILPKVSKHPVRAKHGPGHGRGCGDEAVNTTDKGSSLRRFRSCERGVEPGSKLVQRCTSGKECCSKNKPGLFFFKFIYLL